MWRRHPRACHLDPATGRFVEFWIEGILPTDDPLEGMRQWNIFYSIDRGAPCQLIHEGAEYDAHHPLPGVYTGRNCAMLGDVASLPLTLPNGRILLPAVVSPLASDGILFNPRGGYTYTDAAVPNGDRILYADHIDGHGTELYRAAWRQDLEGIVAKYKWAGYRPEPPSSRAAPARPAHANARSSSR